jgi:hypothetical protein
MELLVRTVQVLGVIFALIGTSIGLINQIKDKHLMTRLKFMYNVFCFRLFAKRVPRSAEKLYWQLVRSGPCTYRSEYCPTKFVLVEPEWVGKHLPTICGLHLYQIDLNTSVISTGTRNYFNNVDEVYLEICKRCLTP